ncbi:MAG: hypothetical protein SGPRY_001947 [Prymnesium sp.]
MPAVLRPWLLVVLALALFSLLLDSFATRQRQLGPARSLRTLDESTATDNASHPLASATQALHGVRTREEASQKVEEASSRTEETNTTCFEIDQGSGLKMPCFWIVPKGLDLEMHKPQAGGEPTILLLVSSYRDFQCRETIAYAFSRAAHPLRLHAAVVDQVGKNDILCDVPPLPCADDDSQPLCLHAGRVRTFRVDARHGMGPTYARHLSHRLYRGEAYVLQVRARGSVSSARRCPMCGATDSTLRMANVGGLSCRVRSWLG